MCVLWQSDLRGLVAFFFTVCPVFVGSLREGDNVDKKSAPILTDWCTHSNIRQKNKKIIY